MKFRTAYSEQVRSQVDFTHDVGHTIQEQYKDTIIENIIEKFNRTGVLDHVSKYEPQFVEVATFDYQENMNKVLEVQKMFQSLPAKERAMFDNDPQKYLDYLSVEANREDIKDGVIDNIPEKKSEEKPEEKTEEK